MIGPRFLGIIRPMDMCGSIELFDDDGVAGASVGASGGSDGSAGALMF